MSTNDQIKIINCGSDFSVGGPHHKRYEKAWQWSQDRPTCIEKHILKKNKPWIGNYKISINIIEFWKYVWKVQYYSITWENIRSNINETCNKPIHFKAK